MILRRAIPEDAEAVGEVLSTTRKISLPFLPILHSPDEFVAFARERLIPHGVVWVAETDAGVVGVIAIREGWIDQLYVLPDHQGQGIGRKLLGKALEPRRPLQLWAFQENARARRFYESRGFRAVQFTDGAGNEEKTPDVRYRWAPA